MSEILAPAGNLACAKAAIHNGADAIYLGLPSFSARQGADNFDEQALKDVLFEAHLFGVKVYVAMNTAVKDVELDAFHQSLLAVWSMGVDAIILQDAYLGKAIHAKYPDIVLHLSTQAGVCSLNGAKFAKECGFSRVILARETPFAEMQAIAEIIETEAFVQGALCTCFSGQCYFSSFAGGNSGNRGRCKQPCRKLYQYDRAGQERSYALSPSDLCVGEDVHKYEQAGICSFKIEGRMRRPEYVAAAVRYYRQMLGCKDGSVALSDLRRTYNRGNYTKGLAFGQDKRFLSTAVQGHLGEKVGVVKVENGQYFVESAFQPQVGDAFKILREGREVGGASFSKALRRGFQIFSKQRLKNGDGVFVTTDTAVNQRVLSVQKTRTIEISLHFHEGECACAEALGLCVYSDEPLQTAQNHPLSEAEARTCFEKTDGLPIEVVFSNVDIVGNCFMPKSVLNAFRRKFYAAFVDAVSGGSDRLLPCASLPLYKAEGGHAQTAILAGDFTLLKADIAIYKPRDFREKAPTSFASFAGEKFVYYPAFCTSQDEEAILCLVRETGAGGVYVENYAGIAFAKENGLQVFAGTGLNLFNACALSMLLQEECVCYYALSKELNDQEQKALIGSRAFVLTTGDIKLMDLCYCPFGKTCKQCDKKDVYTLTDENARAFPVRRYVTANGNCRFEVYNCARLAGSGIAGAGALMDASVDKTLTMQVEEQKTVYKNYTFGHAKRGVL